MSTRNTVGNPGEAVERRLVARLAAGDLSARRRLIEAYLGLVTALARRYAGRWGVPLEDLVQEGALALVRAVDSYDPTKGMKLSTYVTWWVKQAIRRAAMAQACPVRVPERVWDRLGDLSRNEEPAESSGWSEEELEEVRHALKPVVSLEAPIEEDDDTVLEELVPDSLAEDPAEAAARADARYRLAEALAALSGRERTVLVEWSGFEGEPRSLASIGKNLSISRERVRQLERAALKELREKRQELCLEGLVA